MQAAELGWVRLLPGLSRAAGPAVGAATLFGAARGMCSRATMSRIPLHAHAHGAMLPTAGPLRGASATARWGFRGAACFGLGASFATMGYICGGSEPGGAASALSAALLVNGALLAHEAGHLAAARAMGVAVREFSVGVGPKVAWWQGATTTYCLRALPLFGYVSFYSAQQLAAAAQHAAAAAGPPGLWGANSYSARGGGGGGGGLPYTHAAAPWSGGRPLLSRAPAAAASPGVLLQQLPPGRRALVMAAGVAVNAALAAVLVAWQVLEYGELGVVVRPGAKVLAVGGWEELDGVRDGGGAATSGAGRHAAQRAGNDPGVGAAAARAERLRAGDVIMSVGGRRLPGGANMGEALVAALRDEAAHTGGEGEAAALEGVEMVVLRPPGGSSSGAGDEAASSSARSSCPPHPAAAAAAAAGRQQVLRMDALDLLMYETLSVSQNAEAGYRRPADGWEAAAMTGRELTSWMGVVLDCWRQAFAAATGAEASTAASGSTASSGGGSQPQMVGPLGLVASAAAAVAADRASRAPCCAVEGEEGAAAGAQGGGGCGGAGLYGKASRNPHPLLLLGVQLNLQLAAINLLPLPVLDGGQLLLVALEALRRGRRLPAAVEGAALLGSGLLVGAWVAALSARDLLDLVDRAAEGLGAALSPATATSGGAQPSRMRVALQYSPSPASQAAESDWDHMAAVAAAV